MILFMLTQYIVWFISEVPIVWLHDYHLMLAANTIRDTCVEEEISIKMSFLK